jgi:acyl-CoA dehydrogenase
MPDPTQIEELRRKTVEFCARAEAFADEMERSAIVPETLVQEMRALGYFGITIPREYGGLGLGFTGYAVIMAELSKAHAAVGGLVALNNMVASRVILYGATEEQKRRFLPPIASGEHVAAFALTEPGAGSDASGVTTRAVQEGDSYVLNGTKHLIMHAPIAGVVTAIAATEPGRGAKGLSAFVVHKGTPGFFPGKTQKPMAARTTVGELVFESCRIPAAHLIGKPGDGFALAMRGLDDTRFGVGAYCVGAAQKLLDLSLNHARTRRQFGQPLADFQGIQWILAEMAADVQVCRTMLEAVARKADTGQRVSADAAILKLFASEMGCRVADKALQIHGGIGYLDDHPVARVYRDIRIWRIVDGTSEMQKTVIARDLFRNPERYV